MKTMERPQPMRALALADKLRKLEKENAKLKQQIAEMERNAGR